MQAPNHLEVTALGIAAGALIVQRLGAYWVVGVAIFVALVSYGIRYYRAEHPQL